MADLVVENTDTTFEDIILKKYIFLKAHTTASVPKRQDKVFRSKYPKYSLSGGTNSAEINATLNAIHITGFFLTNVITLSYNKKIQL
jgi:hypothetical protein